MIGQKIMKKYLNKSYYLIIIGILAFLFVHPINVNADEEVINQPVHAGEWARYGDYQYGFSTVTKGGGVAPDVELIAPDKRVIKFLHVPKNRNSELVTTNGLNLFTPENMITYDEV